MLRAAAISTLRQRGALSVVSVARSTPQQSRLLLASHNRVPVWRALSNEAKKETKPEEEEMTQEIVLTPGEKVVAGTRLTMWAGIAVFAGFCAYYIGKELIPTCVYILMMYLV